MTLPRVRLSGSRRIARLCRPSPKQDHGQILIDGRHRPEAVFAERARAGEREAENAKLSNPSGIGTESLRTNVAATGRTAACFRNPAFAPPVSQGQARPSRRRLCPSRNCPRHWREDTRFHGNRRQTFSLLRTVRARTTSPLPLRLLAGQQALGSDLRRQGRRLGGDLP